MPEQKNRSGDVIPYSEQQIRLWLGWLARSMQAQGQTVFQLEELDHGWLPKLSKRKRFLLMIFKNLAALLLFYLMFASELAYRLAPFGFIVFIGLLARNQSKKNLGEKLTWSGRFLLKNIFLAIPVVTILYMIFFGTFSLFIGIGELSKTTILMLFPISIFIGLFLVGIKKEVAEMKRTPNEGIRHAGKNALDWGVGGGLLIGLMIGLIVGPKEGLLGALAGALAFAVWVGGLDVFRHYYIRILLAIRGHAPLDLIPFLDYCAEELQFLQKVGGGYIFIHRYLQEHFVGMEPKEKQD